MKQWTADEIKKVRRWIKEGYSASWMAEKLNCHFRPVKAKIEELTGKEYDLSFDAHKWGSNAHICNFCRRAVGAERCCWAKDGKPVDGWDAAYAPLEGQGKRKGRFYDSYHVTRCPEFVEG